MEMAIAPAKCKGIQSVASTEVEQIHGVIWQRNSRDYLVDDLRSVVCLSLAVKSPLLRAQSRVKLLRLSEPDVFFKIHKSQIQAAMQDGRVQ